MLHHVYDYDVRCTQCKSEHFHRVHRNKIDKLLGKKRKYHCKQCIRPFLPEA